MTFSLCTSWLDRLRSVPILVHYSDQGQEKEPNHWEILSPLGATSPCGHSMRLLSNFVSQCLSNLICLCRNLPLMLAFNHYPHQILGAGIPDQQSPLPLQLFFDLCNVRSDRRERMKRRFAFNSNIYK